jgi:alkaline phosphatase
MRTKRLRAATTMVAGVGIAVAAGAVAIGQTGPDKSADIKAAIDVTKPKNVILFIGDGMGEAEVSLARYYAKGAAGRLNMDSLRFRGDITTYNVSPAPQPPYPPNYVPDSAPTGTAWSTGKKTIDGRLSQGPSSATNVPGSNQGFTTYLEIAKARGLSTGNVSTAEITDATPAAPSSHISQRACMGPNDTRSTCPSEAKAAGGLGSIAEQQVDQGFDVTLGGARARYEQPLEAGGTKTVVDYAKEKSFRYVTTKQELAGVNALEPGQKLLGLFHASNMTTEYAPLIASDTGAGSTTTKCQIQDRGNEPSLSEMTSKAISLLQGNAKGFVLQVEGASIDKRDHAADACGQIGETIAMDDAVGVALEFQRTHPDTLIVVSADHSHTSQIISPSQTPRGAFTTLQTVDNAPIRVSYATAPVSGSQGHTGATVPIFAAGPRAADVVGTMDQTEIFGILTNTRTDGTVVAPAQDSADAGGSVPATLSLTLGANPSLGVFTPGLDKTYEASTTAKVISTAADATLSVSEPGKLTNGAFSLAEPLQVTTTPASWSTPVSNAEVAIAFKQHIGADEALRTGAYTKTLTFTLSTTAP